MHIACCHRKAQSSLTLHCTIPRMLILIYCAVSLSSVSAAITRNSRMRKSLCVSEYFEFVGGGPLKLKICNRLLILDCGFRYESSKLLSIAISRLDSYNMFQVCISGKQSSLSQGWKTVSFPIHWMRLRLARRVVSLQHSAANDYEDTYQIIWDSIHLKAVYQHERRGVSSVLRLSPVDWLQRHQPDIYIHNLGKLQGSSNYPRFIVLGYRMINPAADVLECHPHYPSHSFIVLLASV